MCMSYVHPDDDEPPRDDNDTPTMRVKHKYCSPPLKAFGSREHLETLTNWRGKFPLLAQAQALGDLNCEIIHIEASLALRNGRMPEGSELWGQFEILVPANNEEDLRSTWRCTQTMYKPNDLYGPSNNDPKYENIAGIVSVERVEPGVGTHMRVPFPANTWAYALVKLSEMEEQCEEAQKEGRPLPTTLSARQYIDQINMYQEIFCSASPNAPWKRRAIIVWTFKKARLDQRPEAAWRYLDPAPPRRAIFSPHPGPAHVVSAAMAQNFNAWAEAPPLQIQAPTPFDSMMQGLATPPQSAVLHSPFPNYTYQPPQQHDINAENISFMSHETGDSDSTLVETQQQTANNSKYMGNFMASNGHVQLGEYDHSQGNWLPPPVEVGFESDNSFLVNYGTVPSNAPHVWDGGDSKNHGWDSSDMSFGGYPNHHALGQRLIK